MQWPFKVTTPFHFWRVLWSWKATAYDQATITAFRKNISLWVEVVSCWFCSCELQSTLLRRFCTWSAMSFATHLLVAASTKTVVWAYPNITEQLHQWPEHPIKSSPADSKERLPTTSAVIYITIPRCRHGFVTLVTKELYLHIHWIKL